MLQTVPGCWWWLGGGGGRSRKLHHPFRDFSPALSTAAFCLLFLSVSFSFLIRQRQTCSTNWRCSLLQSTFDPPTNSALLANSNCAPKKSAPSFSEQSLGKILFNKCRLGIQFGAEDGQRRMLRCTFLLSFHLASHPC